MKPPSNLPPNVRKKGDNYYYRYQERGVRKEIPLGRNPLEAMQAAKALNQATKPGVADTFKQLASLYLSELQSPGFPFPLSKRTLKDRVRMLSPDKPLHDVFGDMPLSSLTPQHFARYRDNRTAKSAANRELSACSRMFAWAIERGYMTDNPLRDVRPLPEKARKRYITDVEYRAVWEIASAPLRIAMDLSLETGLRMSDVLRLKYGDIREGFLVASEHKVDQAVRFELNRRLQAIIEASRYTVIAANHRRNRPERIVRAAVGPDHHLVRQRGLRPYSFSEAGDPHGFKANWQRTIKRAYDDKLIETRFTFHDIRAKHATDRDEAELDASHALGHADVSTTKRYLRHPLGRRVAPLTPDEGE